MNSRLNNMRSFRFMFRAIKAGATLLHNYGHPRPLELIQCGRSVIDRLSTREVYNYYRLFLTHPTRRGDFAFALD